MYLQWRRPSRRRMHRQRDETWRCWHLTRDRQRSERTDRFECPTRAQRDLSPWKKKYKCFKRVWLIAKINIKSHFCSYSGEEDVAGLGGRYVQAHDIGLVALERLHLLSGLYVPQLTRAVTAAREQLLVRVHELVARYVVGVVGHHLLVLADVLVDGDLVQSDLVVQAAAGDKLARRRVGHRHHPGRWHCHNVLFVCGERVPDHQSTVLEFHINHFSKIWAIKLFF